jgi:hypothetical protein
MSLSTPATADISGGQVEWLEAAYRSGAWDYLDQSGELSRYEVIGGYPRFF